MSVNIIGLGLKDGDVSLSGYKKILSSDKVFLKSGKLFAAKFLKKEKIPFETFDNLFESLEDFDDVYREIAKTLESVSGEICYLTDGSGASDKTASFLEKPYELFPASEKCSRIVKSGNYSVISAYDLISKKNNVAPLADFMYVFDVDNKFVASDVKLALADVFGDEAEVLFLDGKKGVEMPLYEIDGQKKYDYNCGVLVENKDFLHKTRFTFNDLLDIVTALRAPDGCPWDRAATHESIRMNVIEEAYEVAEAIDRESPEMLVEETGDLMLQTVLHAEIAKGDGEYDINDVTTELCQKLIDRHTHVFGKDKVNSAADALKLWDNNKQKLKGEKTATESIEHVSKALPSIMYAEKVAKKAAKANFDFRSVGDIVGKVDEELKELKEAIDSGTNKDEELGDLLFATCNLARFLGIDAELALTRASQKFVSRFEKMEESVLKDGLDMKTMSDEELDKYYVAAKEELKKHK